MTQTAILDRIIRGSLPLFTNGIYLMAKDNTNNMIYIFEGKDTK